MPHNKTVVVARYFQFIAETYISRLTLFAIILMIEISICHAKVFRTQIFQKLKLSLLQYIYHNLVKNMVISRLAKSFCILIIARFYQ